MPAAVGVKLKLLANNTVPPVAASYQITVRPAGTVAVKVGICAPAQIVAVAGLIVGAVMGGQLQSGAVTFWLTSQAVFVPLLTVMATSVPAGMPVTILPEIVPAVAETVPPVAVKLTEYVSKSGAQVTAPIVSAGWMSTCTVIVVVTAQGCAAAFGVKV